jgi:hypothetical protein
MTYTLSFVRCIFDQLSVLASGSITIATELCVSGRTGSFSLNVEYCQVTRSWFQTSTESPGPTQTESVSLQTLSPHPARTPLVCERYVCSSSGQFPCVARIDIADSVYDGCTSPGDGGAISIDEFQAVLHISECEFLRCRSVDGSVGGCVYLHGQSSTIFGFVGIDCSATFAAFCELRLCLGELGSIEIGRAHV